MNDLDLDLIQEKDESIMMEDPLVIAEYLQLLNEFIKSNLIDEMDAYLA